MRWNPHERFSSTVTLTHEAVAAFARAAGDDNPLHRDAEYAKRTRYGRLVASGAHTTSLLMGLTATHFSRGSEMVGLEFWFRFRRPVHAGETVHLEWLVVSARPHSRLGGHVVDLRGRIRDERGATAVGAKGRVLVTECL